MTDRIEKTIELKAPVSRVWRALTDHREFGTWFRVQLEGPFVPGKPSRGQITYPGYEHLRWEAWCRRWSRSGCSRSPGIPTRSIPTWTIPRSRRRWSSSRCEPTAGGTLLRVVESGLRQDPEHRRAEAFRMNEGGWSAQMQNIAQHVAQRPSEAAALKARAAVFAALGDETRLSVLAKLSNGGPQSIARLTAGTRLTRQAVTKHLRVLEEAGVVRSVRVGRESLFELEPRPIDDARDYLA